MNRVCFFHVHYSFALLRRGLFEVGQKRSILYYTDLNSDMNAGTRTHLDALEPCDLRLRVGFQEALHDQLVSLLTDLRLLRESGRLAVRDPGRNIRSYELDPCEPSSYLLSVYKIYE